MPSPFTNLNKSLLGISMKDEGSLLCFDSNQLDPHSICKPENENILLSGLTDGSLRVYRTDRLPRLPVFCSEKSQKAGVMKIENVVIHGKSILWQQEMMVSLGYDIFSKERWDCWKLFRLEKWFIGGFIWRNTIWLWRLMKKNVWGSGAYYLENWNTHILRLRRTFRMSSWWKIKMLLELQARKEISLKLCNWVIQRIDKWGRGLLSRKEVMSISVRESENFLYPFGAFLTCFKIKIHRRYQSLAFKNILFECNF